MFRKLSMVAVCLTATGSVALAQQSIATTGLVSGGVMVNHGSGYVRVAANAPLVEGDRLMAQPGARTTVKYADGCVVRVNAGSTVTIASESPCRKFTAQVGPDDRPFLPPPPPGFPPATPLIVGGLILAGGIAAAVILTSENNGNGGGFVSSGRRGISP